MHQTTALLKSIPTVKAAMFAELPPGSELRPHRDPFAGSMRLLTKDGILVSASCSMHLPEDDLQNILLTSARHLDRNIQLLERGGQGPDHPVHPAIAETRYIKSITCRLLPNS